MIRWILNWIILTFSITAASYFLPFINISATNIWDKFKIAFLAGLLLGLFNLLIKPIIKILSLPINILTLGLFNIAINAGMLWMVDLILKGFRVEGFWGYIWSSLVISIISIIVSKIVFFRRKKD
ncbi:MAG: phage holin family protein [Actinomycetota bacterium]|nr:MAG: phage holin family protein [Actinomycetota bacterium]